MGLVTDTIPSGGTLVSTSLPPGGIYTPTVAVGKVRGFVFTNNTSSDVFNSVGVFDESIYRIFSMQDDMKTISIRLSGGNEFDLFLRYAEAVTAGGVGSEGFVSIDNYLGSLGV